MREYHERIAEMAITDWRGARVQITIEIPQLKNSMSSVKIIDDRDLDKLRWLKRPENIDLLPEMQQRMALVEWDTKRREAERVVEMLAASIANQISHAIGSEI